ncbi:MAG: hypothetical protein GF417_00640 [Candidatus Latescibacteria bacterium]|nr:hypothetical protein [bacterium]MBD3422933.1 hypothetical protein [Candidatus Latescibacterota bacterium]
MKLKKSLALLLAVFMLNISISPILVSQVISLAEGDRLGLKVQQRPELDRMLLISPDGEVNIPETGPVRVEGLSLSEAENIILEKLREIYPDITAIELSLVGEETRRLIYVQGQVVRPGRYEFVDPPNVWEAIREAGGASPSAALESVRIIRGRGDEQRTETVNLQRAIDSGNFSSLPLLRLGDTVFVPERESRISAEGAVIVMGSIAAPGAYNLGEGKRLEDALAAAGGISSNSKLDEISILREDAGGNVTIITVDFSRYLDYGDMENNPVIYPGDTVNIPNQTNILRQMLTNPGYLLALVTTVITVSSFLSD